jgi:hypothetical protein
MVPAFSPLGLGLGAGPGGGDCASADANRRRYITIMLEFKKKADFGREWVSSDFSIIVTQ